MQTLIDAWKKGLSALTYQSAYAEKIQDGFKGNAFDFIEIPADDSDLAYIAVMIPYFATFFFDKPSKAKAFEALIESFSGEHSQLYVCSFDQFGSDRMSQLVKFDITSPSKVMLIIIFHCFFFM